MAKKRPATKTIASTKVSTKPAAVKPSVVPAPKQVKSTAGTTGKVAGGKPVGAVSMPAAPMATTNSPAVSPALRKPKMLAKKSNKSKIAVAAPIATAKKKTTGKAMPKASLKKTGRR